MHGCRWKSWHHYEFPQHQSISPSVLLTLEQQKRINYDIKTLKLGAREVQDQMEDAEEVFDPDTRISVMSTIHNTVNKQINSNYLTAVLSKIYANALHQSKADSIPRYQ